MRLIELSDLPAEQWRDFSTMKTLTCVHHQGARYLTKNAWQRNLHLVQPDPEIVAAGITNTHGAPECPCPFSDLRVVVEDENNA
jgi:hypothetical protein